MKMYVVNQSTCVMDEHVKQMASAINKQMKEVALVYDRKPASLLFRRSIPADAQFVLAVLDDADQAGALGYHDETPTGQVYGRVFAKTVLDNGGTTETGPNSVSVTLSHEACEMFQDPNANQWVEDFRGNLIAVELCDPVEGDSYTIDGIAVSNFVYPAYFDIQTPEHALDRLEKLRAPWSMTAGGYLITMKAGKVSQKWGREMPDWKRRSKLLVGARATKRDDAEA